MDEQRRQDCLKLIQRFWDCGSDQELNEAFSTHRELVDSDFLQTLTEIALDMEARGYRDEATWRLLDRLAEAIGVELAPSLTTNANVQFIIEILQCVEAHQGAAEPVYALLKANQVRLNADLLAALPGVAAGLLAGAEGETQRDRATVLAEFGNLMQQFPLGQRAINMELAIASYQQALTVLAKAAMPVEWAKTIVNLASAYAGRIRGNKAQNIDEAIASYQQALTVLTKAAMPVEWAQAMNNLALAYAGRIQGNKAQNIDDAIASYQQALTVLTKAAMPVEWAQAMNNLALAYAGRIRGNKAQNIDDAIASYQQALTVLTKAAMPVQWAKTIVNLASAYCNRIRGDKAQNIDDAIAAYQQALTVLTKAAMPVEWAQTMMNLASAYLDRIRGDKAQNIEDAIAAYQQALTVMTQAVIPVEWATTMNNLANAYLDRIQGDKAQNIEDAIAAYQQALTVMTQAAMPVEWATTMNNLANAYPKRILCEKAKNIEEAIAAYQQALTVRTQAALPIEWAQTMMNLANAYLDRIQGDKAQNIEDAIAANQQALTVVTQTALPFEWATTMNNLANAYRNRILGEKAKNIEEAIAAYQQALTVRTQAALPIEWAQTMMNLANAYLDRIQGDKSQNIEASISAYQQALTVTTKAAMPIEWAQTMSNLANAYLDRILGEKAENIEASILACQQALTVKTQAAMPVEWAGTMMNLANAYLGRIRGDRTESLEHAITAYQQVLQVRTREAMPLDWAGAMKNLAIAYRAADRWPDAYTTYAETITSVEALRSEIRSGDDAKQKHAEEWNRLYQGIVTTCLHLGNPTKALEYAERSKARNLIDLLVNRIEPQRVSTTILEKFHNLKKAIKTEELRLQSEEITRVRPIAPNQVETYTTRPIPDRTQLNILIEQLEHLIKTDIQRHDSKFVATQTVEPFTYRQIQALLPNPQTALIEWYVQNDTLLTFVVTQHSLAPKVIATEQEDFRKFTEWAQSYIGIYFGSPITVQALLNLRLKCFDEGQASTPEALDSQGTQQPDFWLKGFTYLLLALATKWHQVLTEHIHDLAEILKISDVIEDESLAGCNALILVPHRFLHLLPLHVLPLTTHPSLLDRFPAGIRYAPCCQLLHLTQQPTQADFTHLLAIQNPTNDLPFTDVEVDAIRPLFDPQVQVLAKHEAHKAAVTTQTLQPGHVLHFACHGQFNWQDPLQAGLLLAASPPASIPSKDGQETDTTTDSPQDAASSEGDPEANSTEEQKSPHLTLGNLFSRDIDLTHCRLVTLSACETGQVDFRSTSDEYIGLPSGFLFAGSPSVVSSLWRVDDLSTSLLMVKFYKHLKEDRMAVPVALNKAQTWLRNATKAEL